MQESDLFGDTPRRPLPPPPLERGFSQLRKRSIQSAFDAETHRQSEFFPTPQALPRGELDFVPLLDAEIDPFPGSLDQLNAHQRVHFAEYVHEVALVSALQALRIDLASECNCVQDVKTAIAELNWIYTDSVDGIPAQNIAFSFLSCCAVMGLDADQVRLDLLQMDSVRALVHRLGYKLPPKTRKFFGESLDSFANQSAIGFPAYGMKLWLSSRRFPRLQDESRD